MILPLDFFHRDTVTVARELLGKKLVVKQGDDILSGIITETEAYRGQDDPASHAYPGITPRNRLMYETYGHVYVYLIYGMYHCLNFTTESLRSPGAVLIRSIMPIDGIDSMQRNRQRSSLVHLTDGPGKLCQALGITKTTHNGLPLTPESGIFLEDIGYPITTPMCHTRIGITK